VDVQVILIDVNDNAPDFVTTIHNINVSEGLAIGTPVAVAVATDADISTANNMVSYSLMVPSARFAVDPLTGTITIAAILAFDFKNASINAESITIIASDNGVPTFSTAFVLNVNILENTPPPYFTSSNTSMSIPEGVSSLPFYTATAWMPRLDQYTYLFSIISSTPDSNAFAIDMLSGNLLMTSNLSSTSAVRASVYTVTLQVTGSNGKFAQMTVSVPLVPRIAFSPVFDSDSFSATINENAVKGSSVLTVRAHIPPFTNTVAVPTIQGYYIDPNSDIYSLFTINGTTGAITLRRNLYTIPPFNSTKITVWATNSLTPFLCRTALL